MFIYSKIITAYLYPRNSTRYWNTAINKGNMFPKKQLTFKMDDIANKR